MTKHSHGPFTYKSSTQIPRRAAVQDAYGTSIASLIGLNPTWEQMDANGRLFAAAPDLLQACKLALSSCDPHSTVTRQIQDAIEKAEGGKNGPMDDLKKTL